VILFCALLVGVPAVAAERTLAEWTFDREGDLQGWQPNGHLVDVKVSAGTLTAQGAGADPILELQPRLDLKASPWQFFEARLKADRDGIAELFWGNTDQGRYGGFSQEMSTRFNVAGDGQWHTYRLFPFWHAAGKIVRLRLDPFDRATFGIDLLRVGELAMPPPSDRLEFDFPEGAAGWQALGGATTTAGTNGLTIRALTPDGFVLAPPVQVDAAEPYWVSLRLAVDRGRLATLFFATETSPGLRRFTFPVDADGHEHTYNLDLLAASDWRGRILALGFRPSEVPDANAALRWLKVSDRPQGPAQFKVVSFGLEEALPRVRRPTTLSAVLSNTGGTTATNVQARLILLKGLRLAGPATADQRVATLESGEEVHFTWRVEALGPLEGEVALRVSGADGEPASARAPVSFTRRLRSNRGDYVPEPKPVRGPAEVGAYYFPGWKTASQWHPIQRFPERKPVLGWYREGDPEVADWHIKWAVEHGITFFAYDWYWSRGARQLEHALHDGYFQARYRHLLKFCLLWANHNPPGSATPDDCLAVTRFWIEHYFRRPEHLTVEGKPVVIIFSPQRLTDDLGSAGVRETFAAMRAECQQAGLKGLYLIACVGGVGQARLAAQEGYDAVTAYNWPALGMTGDGLSAPFETLLEGYRRNWEHLAEQGPIPLLPVPVCGGWDSRPWHGENNLVRYGRTPELFRRHLLDARRFIETWSPQSGIQNLILIEAWNEWGEGSYIEPHREFGFGYLDALREAFTTTPKEHVDLTPADVGLGPYDVPEEALDRTDWEFRSSDEGWGNVMDLADVKATSDVLQAQTTGNDPAFFGPPMQVRAGEFSAITLRMKLTSVDGHSFADSAQLFWRTRALPESEATAMRFEVVGDGEWHAYRVPVSQNRRWRDAVTRLRLDPCNRSGVQVDLDWIRLVRRRGDQQSKPPN